MGGRGSAGRGRNTGNGDTTDHDLARDGVLPDKPKPDRPAAPRPDAPIEEWDRHTRAVYDHLATGTDWVRLADLRPLLGDAPRDVQDQILRDLSRNQDFVIAPISNRKILTAEDHNAAIRIGGQDNHWICKRET